MREMPRPVWRSVSTCLVPNRADHSSPSPRRGGDGLRGAFRQSGRRPKPIRLHALAHTTTANQIRDMRTPGYVMVSPLSSPLQNSTRASCSLPGLAWPADARTTNAADANKHAPARAGATYPSTALPISRLGYSRLHTRATRFVKPVRYVPAGSSAAGPLLLRRLGRLRGPLALLFLLIPLRQLVQCSNCAAHGPGRLHHPAAGDQRVNRQVGLRARPPAGQELEKMRTR